MPPNYFLNWSRITGLALRQNLEPVSPQGEIQMRYAVIVEEGENSFGAHVPDLPGCVAVAETREAVLELIQEAIEFHIDGLREEGQPIPEPSSSIEYVEVRAA